VCQADEAVRGSGDAVDATGFLRSRLDLPGHAVYMAFWNDPSAASCISPPHAIVHSSF
jgi:hypothetical protein